MTEKMIAKGIRIAHKDIDTVEVCREWYGLGTFSDAIRFIIREWRRGRSGVTTSSGLGEKLYNVEIENKSLFHEEQAEHED